MLAAVVEVMFGASAALCYYTLRKYGLRFPELAPDMIVLSVSGAKRERQTLPKIGKVAIGLTFALISITSGPSLFGFRLVHLSVSAREALVPILLMSIALAEICYRISKGRRMDSAPTRGQ